MEPSCLTQLCRTVGDPHLVLEAFQKGALPDADTLKAACQRVAQVYEAQQHLARCYNHLGEIRQPQLLFFNGLCCYHALWERVIEKLIAMGATVDGASIHSLQQKGMKELAQKVQQACAPARMKQTE